VNADREGGVCTGAAALSDFLAAFGFDNRLAMGAQMLDVPQQASVNFGVIGNVLSAKAEGVVVTGMLLGKCPSAPQGRDQKDSRSAFQNKLHSLASSTLMDKL
jgi:hypothetical protein